MSTTPPPVERFPRSVRHPYDRPAVAPHDALMGVDTERWRQARRADRTAALAEPLAGLDLSEYERRVLAHIAEASDTDVVAVLNRVLHAARAAAPMSPPCVGADDLCGAPAGVACAPGCPSLAADPDGGGPW